MSTKAAKPTTRKKKTTPPPSLLSGMTLAVQLLDTTWRVAVPIIGLSLLGIRLDNHYHTRPDLTIAGLLLSLIIATLLVYLQVKSAYPDFFKGDKS